MPDHQFSFVVICWATIIGLCSNTLIASTISRMRNAGLLQHISTTTYHLLLQSSHKQFQAIAESANQTCSRLLETGLPANEVESISSIVTGTGTYFRSANCIEHWIFFRCGSHKYFKPVLLNHTQQSKRHSAWPLLTGLPLLNCGLTGVQIASEYGLADVSMLTNTLDVLGIKFRN